MLVFRYISGHQARPCLLVRRGSNRCRASQYVRPTTTIYPQPTRVYLGSIFPSTRPNKYSRPSCSQPSRLKRLALFNIVQIFLNTMVYFPVVLRTICIHECIMEVIPVWRTILSGLLYVQTLSPTYLCNTKVYIKPSALYVTWHNLSILFPIVKLQTNFTRLCMVYIYLSQTRLCMDYSQIKPTSVRHIHVCAWFISTCRRLDYVWITLRSQTQAQAI